MKTIKTMKRALIILAAVFTTGALLSACGATINKAGEELNPRVEAAMAAFGPGFDYMIIEPDSALGDAMFVGFFGGAISSDLSRELYERIVKAESEGKRFMVTGPRSAKTSLVIIQALFRAPDNGLPNLELLYLGDEENVQRIEESVKRVGGTMRFAPYPG
jgi:hypothetical protein